MRYKSILVASVVFASCFMFIGCPGPEGPAGPLGSTGAQGERGEQGAQGSGSRVVVETTISDAANSIPNGSGQFIPVNGISPDDMPLAMVYVNLNGGWDPLFGQDDDDHLHSNTFQVVDGGVVVYVYENGFQDWWRSRPIRVVVVQ